MLDSIALCDSTTIHQKDEPLLNYVTTDCNSTQILKNATSFLSHDIDASIDTVANISVQDSSTTSTATSNALNALTMAINNHMTSSSQQITNKRKRAVERPYGENLTTMDALLKVNEKEKNKTQKATRKPQSASIKKRLVLFFLSCDIPFSA
ncbi:unnamed protein product [Rotaria sp. Silwood2]|nr:unnamed protein product [Rotaria sp. Silwood2]CAF4765375.1 unnamed protein product [Rotaria sp. Silwood2]